MFFVRIDFVFVILWVGIGWWVLDDGMFVGNRLNVGFVKFLKSIFVIVVWLIEIVIVLCIVLLVIIGDFGENLSSIVVVFGLVVIFMLLFLSVCVWWGESGVI